MATLHRPMARWPSIEQGLRDDAHGVREVDDPGTRRGASPDLLREIQHDRHGPQRLGEAARPGRLLADEPESMGQRLVRQAGLLSADTQLDEHEVGALESLVATIR